VFVALEGKAPGGNATLEQENFIFTVLKHGGLGGVFHNVNEASAILQGIEQ
jgi:hypothetical protein